MLARRSRQPACERHPRRFNQIARLINAASQRSEPFVSVVSDSQAAPPITETAAPPAGERAWNQTGNADGEVKRSGLGRVGGEAGRGVYTPTTIGQEQSGVLTAAAVLLHGPGTWGQIAGDGFAVNNSGGGADGDGWGGPGANPHQPPPAGPPVVADAAARRPQRTPKSFKSPPDARSCAAPPG